MKKDLQRGFTLVEMIVAIALFAVVMLVAVGSLLSLTGADRKAQALQSVMNNLNISLDGIVRNVRMGTKYHCGTGNFVGDGTDDCANGNTVFSFTCNPTVGNCSPGSPRWELAYGDGSQPGCAAKSICKSVDGGASWTALTAPEITVDSMKFYVVGSKPGDNIQPKVLIVVRGEAGPGR